MTLAVLTLLVGVQGEPKVNVTIYMESLCRHCTDFLRGQFSPYWLSLQYNVNIKLVPYGRARYVNSTLHCRHGPNECAINKIMACAMKHFPGYNEVVPFVLCLQQKSPDMMESCSEPLAVDHAKLKTCVEGKEGDYLMEVLYKETAKLIRRIKVISRVPILLFDDDIKIGGDVPFGEEVCRRLPETIQKDKCNWFHLKRNGQRRSTYIFSTLGIIIVIGFKTASLLS
ncbi:unnamed protein product [Soboliphyme baturini]|uniref:Gamma interferon inducible lysosomal thiol reductase GILT n=1 Tax=Soboliphyme baturini TaxID=241478 RepID=A0A183J0D6_9BILA|nr:unnamed protein product [Soboliphyme baturini]